MSWDDQVAAEEREQGPCLWGGLYPPGPFVNQFDASWLEPWNS